MAGSLLEGFVKDEIISLSFQIIIWGIRLQQDASSVKRDLRWILLCLFWFCREDLQLGILRTLPYRWVFICSFLACIVFLGVSRRRRIRRGISQPWVGREGDTAQNHHAKLSLKPLVFPCRTSHTRFFPQKHSFSYSYLFVGVPVGFKGSAGFLLSADNGSKAAKSWFHIEPTDYLSRGNDNLGLQGKLHLYLKSQVSGESSCKSALLRNFQGEDAADYPSAYLVTAPRFLGYSFNPVSFWYLYSSQGTLAAMILEVNNTFDEKRIYFLKSQKNKDIRLRSESENSVVENVDSEITLPQGGNLRNEDGSVPSTKEETGNFSSSKFKSIWAKDFHVSPFNSRKGNYALSADDPFSPSLSGNGGINNTITLTSSKNHVKLIARIFSTQPSLDPSSLGLMEEVKMVASWWWVGFVTFPRILREAAKLFFQKRLHVWYRPEVLKGSIGRRETHDEK